MGRSVVTPAEHQERIRESEKALERLRAERDDLDDTIGRWEAQYEQRKAAAARAGIMEAGLKRSTMTPKQKSEIIRELGGQAYLALPWD